MWVDDAFLLLLGDWCQRGWRVAAQMHGYANAAVVYANTDSVFVRLPGRTAAEAVEEGRAMAEYVSSHARLPATLMLEFERVLSPCLLVSQL